jgi:hypothetical protein
MAIQQSVWAAQTAASLPSRQPDGSMLGLTPPSVTEQTTRQLDSVVNRPKRTS